jgi:hypothetical protein
MTSGQKERENNSGEQARHENCQSFHRMVERDVKTPEAGFQPKTNFRIGYAFCLSILADSDNRRAMKSGLSPLLALLIGAWSIASAQEAATNGPPRIPASQARTNIGKEVIVTGTVADVNKAERLVRLNLDKPYPNQALTAVIWADKTNLFPEIEKLKGKSVEIRGKITDYRSRPEIVVSSTNQLTVLEKPVEKPAAEGK